MDEEQMKMAEELLFTGEEKPSFAKLLYFGLFDAERIFPFPSVQPAKQSQTQAFLEKVKAFCENELDPDAIDRQAEIPESIRRRLGEMGVMGMTVPEQYGGLNMSQDAYCQTMELVARYCASTALLVNAHQSIGLKALLLFGTQEQRDRWLPDLAAGRKLAAFSLTEPTAGSDAAGVKTRAVYDPQKNVYRITGRKQWTTSGSIADVLTVMARTEIKTDRGIEDKITAFLVTPDMPGFKVLDKALEKTGMRGTWTANLELNDVEVPVENVLGPLGGGLRVCLTVLDYGRTTFGATCTGTAKFLLENAIRHATERQQFNRPLASFGLVKEKITRMSALVYAMDATVKLTAGLVDRGQDDIMLESAILKVFASDSQWQILYDTMQILGGRSFFCDAPYERMMRDARLNMIGEGSNEVMRAFIGAVGMRDVGMQLKGVADAAKAPLSDFGSLWSFGKFMAGKVCTPKVPIQSGQLADEAQRLGRAVRSFGLAIPRLLAKYREKIVEEQLHLNRISECAMALYTVSAVLSKLDSDIQRAGGDPSRLGTDLDVARFYCHEAFARIDSNLTALSSNSDEIIYQLSDRITGVAPAG
ncbi:MAG: acyl-CoA dehydrogenase family protein [Chlamydiia bacterium]|nr:acyl-CoA dehydrogenase family protein [Chlamydiia bacterium]